MSHKRARTCPRSVPAYIERYERPKSLPEPEPVPEPEPDPPVFELLLELPPNELPGEPDAPDEPLPKEPLVDPVPLPKPLPVVPLA